MSIDKKHYNIVKNFLKSVKEYFMNKTAREKDLESVKVVQINRVQEKT